MKNVSSTLRATAILLMVWICSSPLFGQIERKSASILKWKNNNTLVLTSESAGSRLLYEYNIATKQFKDEGTQQTVQNRPNLSVLKTSDLNATLSPDSLKVAFTRNNDLYSIDLKTGAETRYTFDGSDVILNGRASWVYYEEIFGRKSFYRAFWWSPDSKKLAFYRFDDTNVPMFPIYHSDGQHGFIEQTRYPKAGDNNPTVKIGIVPAEGGKVVWADFNDKDDQYFGTPYWCPDSKSLLVQWMDRDQSNLRLYSVSPDLGNKTEIYKEYQKTWVEWIEEIGFGAKGFYFVRDVDMWAQIYYQSYDGKEFVKLTEGKNWATKIISIDESNCRIFYSAKCDSPVKSDFYTVKWNKKYEKKIQRLSCGDFNFSNIMLSPDKKYFASVISNHATMPRIVIMPADKGTLLKNGEMVVVNDTKDNNSTITRLPETEIIYMTTPDGYKLPASVMWPLNMDRSKKYPLLLSIYGGPDSPMVKDVWKAPSQMEMDLAKAGVIQMTIENRASGSCGKEGENFIHRNLGKYEIKDFIEWAKLLKAMPFIDGEKIGITGFSFGGTMVLLALTDGADYFKYGIAGGGVYDWSLYDSHYTERYMDSPKDNPEGYHNSAVLNKVGEYKSESGSLLYITHGTGDDNVHMQNTMHLIDSLQKANKHFELMLYPGGKHGYRGYQNVHSDNSDMLFWKKTLLSK